MEKVGQRAAQILDSYIPEDYQLNHMVALGPNQRITVKNLVKAAAMGVARWHDEKHIGMREPPRRDTSMHGIYEALRQVNELQELQNEYGKDVYEISRMKNNFFRRHFPILTGSKRTLGLKEEKARGIREKIEGFTVPIRLLAAAMDAAELEHILNTDETQRQRHASRALNFHGPLLRAMHEKGREPNFDQAANDLETRALPNYDKDNFRKTLQFADPILSALKRDHALLDAAFREVIHGFDKDSEVDTRVKTMAATHRKWFAPPEEKEQSGREKYKNPSNMPDLFGACAVLKGASQEDCRRTAFGIMGKTHGLTLVEAAPETLLVRPDDDEETAEAKKRVGLLKVKSIYTRKDYYAANKPGQYRAYHLGIDFEPGKHVGTYFGGL
ncbi:MAG: hypothetical protein Q8P02_02395, partial [Candidatus Micrarchaeota archaeon]|nr:hypothetical protein [Candidatus Micrarchaeota archaeon]